MSPASEGPTEAIPAAIHGLLIAGGHGRRAGGPKALIQTAEGLLWRVQVARLQQAGCEQVVAVLHPTALPAAAPPGTTLVAAAPDAPMFASLQLGLATLATSTPDSPLPVLMLPVDCPMPAMSVTADLLAAVGQVGTAPWQVARPRHGQRHGHPLLLAPSFCQLLRQQDPNQARLDRLIAAQPAAQALSVPVADAGILANFNGDGLRR